MWVLTLSSEHDRYSNDKPAHLYDSHKGTENYAKVPKDSGDIWEILSWMPLTNQSQPSEIPPSDKQVEMQMLLD